MKRILFTLGAALVFSFSAQAGAPSFDQEQAPYTVPQTKVVVVPQSGDNTGIYVGAFATIVAAGIGYLGVRYQRKK
jgi:hypothetical protein